LIRAQVLFHAFQPCTKHLAASLPLLVVDSCSEHGYRRSCLPSYYFTCVASFNHHPHTRCSTLLPQSGSGSSWPSCRPRVSKTPNI
jgi:hypothetical protein